MRAAAALTAGAVGPSPARLTLTGAGGHTAAVHTLLSTVCCRENKRERERERSDYTSTQQTHIQPPTLHVQHQISINYPVLHVLCYHISVSAEEF